VFHLKCVPLIYFETVLLVRLLDKKNIKPIQPVLGLFQHPVSR